MKLVVGLGNPGEKYEKTRHNVGFMVVDRLAGDKNWARSKGSPLEYVFLKAGNEDVEVIKPQTFMNNSGEAVKGPFRKHKELTINDLIVVHDDLDIRLGEYKIQKGKGPLLHYGVESIEKHLKTKEFWRVRIGVENREVKGNKGIPGEKYSLMNFSNEERLILDKVTAKIVDELKRVLS